MRREAQVAARISRPHEAQVGSLQGPYLACRGRAPATLRVALRRSDITAESYAEKFELQEIDDARFAEYRCERAQLFAEWCNNNSICPHHRRGTLRLSSGGI